MNFLSTVSAFFILVALQSSAFPPFHWGSFAPDLTVGILLYLCLFRPFRTGVFQASILGYLMDLASGTPSGLHLLAFLFTFLGVQAVRTRVTIFKDSYGVIISAFPTALLLSILVAVLSRIFIPGIESFRPFFPSMFMRSLMAVPAAPLMLWLFRRIDAFTGRNRLERYRGRY